jgi:hypothetical protein
MGASNTYGVSVFAGAILLHIEYFAGAILLHIETGRYGFMIQVFNGPIIRLEMPLHLCSFACLPYDMPSC